MSLQGDKQDLREYNQHLKDELIDKAVEIGRLATRIAELEDAYRRKCLQTERWLDACVDISNGHMDTAGCVQRAVDALK
jgi:hypothetical protein